MKRFPRRDINKLVRALKSIAGVDAAVVYGSIARGDYGPRSDIDVLVIVSELDIVEAAQDLLAGLQLKRAVQPLIRTAEQLEGADSGLMRNIFVEGFVLFAAKPLLIPAAGILDVNPWVLYIFDLKNLPQNEKARFNRQLYSSLKHGPTGGGLLGEVGGKKIARGCVMVPASGRARLDVLFRRFKVQINRMEVWK